MNINEFILNILDDSDERILSGEKADVNIAISVYEYAWYSFVKEQGKKQTDLYSFLAALSACNITRQALFFDRDSEADYSNLYIYLDSPIIFALLGMDESSRTEAYNTLLTEIFKAKCSVHILDHNFQEIDGIIARAIGWAKSPFYDLRKANRVARFFHDSRMSEVEMEEYHEKIETKLNEYGITVKKTDYDIFQNAFQEDEKTLFDMVKGRYVEQGYELSQEKEQSIRVDVRSIIMIYRERQGQTATRLQNAKHIMLTSNNAIANVSKMYESNKSINSGHIPACISADLFGAILWLNSPTKMMQYQKQKLLADCYSFLMPDKVLLDKYIQSLDDAKNSDAIDEKQYLFLRSHKVVLDSLMDITKGDYARFNANTYLEVYDEIQAKSQKRYKDEVAAHEETRKQLKDMKEFSSIEIQKKDEEIKLLQEEILSFKDQERKRRDKELEKKVKIWGWILTTVLVGIPYIILVVAIELVKTKFSEITWCSAYGIAGTIVATAIAGSLFALGKKKCFKKVRLFLESHR